MCLNEIYHLGFATQRTASETIHTAVRMLQASSSFDVSGSLALLLDREIWNWGKLAWAEMTVTLISKTKSETVQLTSALDAVCDQHAVNII